MATRGGFVRPAFAFTQPSLDPLAITKFAMPLVIPPAMPRSGRARQPRTRTADYYEIAVRQFQQQILPAGLPVTTVWGYGSVNHPSTFNYPSFTIEARWKRPVRVKWINGLTDASGNFLPHLLPIDQTVHWANPPGPRDYFSSDPSPYTGPVPIVTHVHGAHTTDESDGYAEAWFLPRAQNIPAGYFRTGTWYDFFKNKFAQKYGESWEPGSASFQYLNDQRASTMWYHDHSLGMTRANVYAGPAGFYLLRGGPADGVTGTLPGPYPTVGSDPFGTFYEIPLAIQDRSFNDDGSLFYPDSREFFDGFAGPYIPDPTSDISPIWNPEFFGNTMLVNGRTWPVLNVEKRRYRFRFLNGCNSRFLILKLTNAPRTDNDSPNTADYYFYQIGSEGGFLPAPVQLDYLLMGPAERADVIVDFSQVPVGTEVFLVNDAGDEPFGGGVPGDDFRTADWQTTGLVMKFIVGPRQGADRSTPAMDLILPSLDLLPAPDLTRQVSLNEEDSETLPDVGPESALLGTVDLDSMPGTPLGIPMMWMHPVSENPDTGDTEVWEIYNFTEDAHPIHLHEVMFEVVNREVFDPMSPDAGQVRPPEAWETGTKDTVVAYPGEITCIKAMFDLAGQYVWHCHIVEHEDNEMMRPYRIGPEQPGQPGT
ncbi:MAG: bilirubin oxidase [Chloroflexi bacterium RBG_16_54_18]|nr:MAG: bilirubin oxidase [Chloroflexi bacterium RBG_16_54_18]